MKPARVRLTVPRPCIVIFAILLACAAARSAESRANARCDELLASVIKKPYGWAWATASAEATLPDGRQRPIPKDAAIVSFAQGGTPSMGLLLHDAGLTLRREDCLNAARQVARGILAAQEPSGRIPSSAIFSTSVSRLDGVQAIPDRASTCAGLGLLLRIIQHQHDEQFRRGAARAALWLMRQQTSTGVWPVLCAPETKEEDEPAVDRTPARLVRLDGRDYRDCTLALLYAGRTMDDKILQRAGERAAQQLVRLGVQQSRTARGLWHTAYELNGQPSLRLAAHARTIDTLASRYCVQTLLAASVMSNDAELLEAARIAGESLRKLRYDDGLWQRLYEFRDGELERPAGDAPRPTEVFADPNRKISPLLIPADFGLPRTLSALDEYLVKKTIELSPAPTLTGLTDHPESAAMP